MWNVWLEEAQGGFKIARRNINNFRYADDTILVAESEEELKSLLMRVEEAKKKLTWNSIFKKLMASGPITSWQIHEGKVETVADFILGGGAPKSLQMVTTATKLKDACSLERKLWPT